MKVAVTGAAGYIGTILLPGLRDRYDLRLIDLRPMPGTDVTDVHVADLAAEGGAAAAGELFAGAEVVVHLGYIHSGAGDVYDQSVPHLERFDAELANVRMAYNVYRGALEAGVRRVVVASSNHAADWYEHALVHRGLKDMVEVSELPLSDNFYGWSKAAYELLAYPFACGTFGRTLEVVLVRIGAPREVTAEAHIGRPDPPGPGPGIPGGVAGLARDLGGYMSDEDGRQIFVRAIEAEDIRNEHGIPWLVVYGISGNTRAFWSLESARRVLGFRPADNSEERFAGLVRRWLDDPSVGEAEE